MRSWLMVATGACLALTTTPGCAPGPTQILIVVDSDLSVPDELDAIEITVVHPDGVRSQRSMAALAGGSGLPRSLAMSRGDGPLGPYRVTVVGRLVGAAVVTRVGELTFVPNEIRVWRVSLDRACVGVDCDAQTCSGGECRSTVVTEDELGFFGGEDPDAGGAGEDGGFVDACTPAGEELCDGRDQDCDGVIDEGFDLDTDPGHCGRCGNRCAFDNGAGVCMGGTCVVISCDAGFADCNASTVDGCEVDIRTPDACGSCTNACRVANGTPGCAGGTRCEVASCTAPFADCNVDYADGCETDTDSDEAHCGRCGTECPATEVCLGGTCCEPGCAGCEQMCSRDAPCTCMPGCRCALDCSSQTFCSPVCDGAGTRCDVDLQSSSNSSAVCVAGAECTMDARGSSNAEVSCGGAGTSCDVDCRGSSNCSLSCTDDAACVLRCGMGATNCDIDLCSGPVTSCPGQLQVCGRACP